MRTGFLLAFLATAAFGQEIVAVHGDRVTLHYDFEDPRQLADFEAVRPDGLLGKSDATPRIEKGRLHLAGNAALRLKHASRGAMRARFTVRVTRAGDAGALWLAEGRTDRYGFLTLDDRTFDKRGGLLLGAVGVRDENVDPRGEALVWRRLAHANLDATAKHAAPGEDVSVALAKDGFDETVRVGGLWRKGRNGEKRSLPLPGLQLGLFVRNAAASFDDLTVTLVCDLRPARNPRLAEESDGALVKTVKAAPLSRPGLRAAQELAARGPKGWTRLAGAARALARKKPYAILPLVRVLGAGGEPERRELLAGLHRKVKAPDVRLAVATALAPAYPEHETLFLAALRSKLDGRRELFRELVWHGLATKHVKRCFDDPLLAGEAYQVVRMRGEAGGNLGRLPRLLAAGGHTRRDALAFAQDFAADPDWELALAIAKLLADKDGRIARGAYLLLLTISDKDIAPDTDLWRSWISAKRAAYAPPGAGDPGPVAAAILRARAFLRKDIADDGACTWPTSAEWPATRVGATALAVYALKSAGLPSDDPALRKALAATVLPGGGLRGDLEGYTYALSLIAMALEAVDRDGYREVKETLARRLIEGQLENGQWTYYCERPDYARRPKRGDNSNTQFAILGLRSLRRCGVKIDAAAFKKTATHFLGTRNAFGGWGYGDRSFHHEMSMTAAGISTLAICAEGIHGPRALRDVEDNKQIGAGQLRLGELLLNDGYAGQEIYTLYGVERACILTGTRSFNDFDWYRVGAARLVRSQQDDGAWGDDTVRGVDTGRGYGRAVDTCFALLFLKRSTTGLAGADGEGVVKIPKHRRPTRPR